MMSYVEVHSTSVIKWDPEFVRSPRVENVHKPPNINFTQLRSDIPFLVEGRLKVVSEPIKLDGPLVNSFCFGGANTNALLKNNTKEKVNHRIPDDNLPRMVTWSGEPKKPSTPSRPI